MAGSAFLKRWQGPLGAVALALATVAAFPALAGASTTIGQTSDSPMGCSAGGPTAVFWTSGTGKSLYTVPSAGVVSSWTTNPGSSAGDSTRLEVIRPTASNTVVGESAIQTDIAMHNGASFPTNIPVQAGDVIALENISSTEFACVIPVSGDAVSADTDNGPGQPIGPPLGTEGNFRIDVAATVTGPPTSSAAVPSCPTGGPVTGKVTADSGTTAKALHFKLDGGPEQTIATTGSPGAASVTVPTGLHSLEFWGEDQLGQLEAAHHTVTVGCPVAPLVAATLSGASVSNKVFADSASPKLVTTARKHRAVGTTFKYTLDKPASVRFDFTQSGKGRKVNGKCVPRTKRNTRKRKCSRTLIRGSLTFAGHAGQNTVKFYGWLSRRKKLKPGRYTLVITATTPGAGSTSQTLKFTIVK